MFTNRHCDNNANTCDQKQYPVSTDVQNRYFILVWFLKNWDSIRNEFGSVRFEKCGSYWIYYSYLLLM